ncbi:TonB-linked outer membrane protein, SusC/RagA family [Porphyromonadaceae bacterium NLAE-zl-C104]|nr:TonB-linked outer membrane protein, SusC/RagA family [Porphyromonadaceae bacterium NLAE-zl-C104]
MINMNRQRSVNNRYLYCFLIGMSLILLKPVTLNAGPLQNNTVTGTVVSATDGEPLVGVSIFVKGTSNGTVTDIDGNYSINVNAGQTLVFSYIGFISQEMIVREKVINVSLVEDTEVLDELIVIGYGVQRKKLSTGATVQVKGDDLAKLNTISPLQALQGRTPGVNISSTSGQPGSDMKVVIRGLGTIGNSGPLYIIDGIEGDISVLNASDIQSIDVLKDAASAAIYGAQAANGVVLVTTRQGAKGRGVVSFDAYSGVQQVARTTKLLNAHQYKTIMNEQSVNSGGSVIDFDSMDGLADTNWIERMFKDNAKTQNYTLNVNGGSETSVYSISLNYTAQEGIVGGKDVSNYERYGFRINSEHSLYQNILKVGQHLNFNYIMNNGINVGNQYNNTLRGAFATSPLSPVYSDNNPHGSPYNDTTDSPWYNGDGNPYGSMMTNSNNKNDGQKLMADIYAELEPVKNLKLRSVFGINYYATEYRSYTPIYRFSVYNYNEDHTTTSQSMSKGHSLTWTNTAGYDFKVADDHSFNALVGMESVRYQGTYLNASNWNLLSQFNDFSHAYLDNTTGQAHLDSDGNVVETRNVGGGPEYVTRRASYFGRIGYNYLEKYMFNTTLRIDGSSKFAKGHRWGYFPSFSAGWVITNEEFMNGIADNGVLDFLKLRASWGQVGNQDIANNQYSAPVNTSTGYNADNPAAYYPFGTNKVNVPGAYPSRLSNENIKWETSEQFNVGIDAYFLRNRLDVNADFYIKTTKDWLVEAPILATAGTGAPYINGGDVKNTGVELAFNWRDRIGQFNYNIGVNGAYNRNRVGNIPTEDGIIHGAINMLYDNSEEFYRAENGYAIGYFWGYKTAGLFQSEEDIAAWRDAGNGILQTNVQPGDVKYVDLNHDGKIDSEDKTDLGNGMPDFTFGLNVGFDYKGFDFSLSANGVMGNKIVQSYRNHANKQANYTTAILQRWTGEGTSNRIPRVTETNTNWQFSDLYLQDGDFLRINNITVGYDFKKLVDWKFLSQCRLYASVQNAFTFTKYDGMDPEIGYGTENWVSGIDLGYYPRPRTFLLGINLKF